MHLKKAVKYGYSVETKSKRKLSKPLNLTKILLTPTNSKFLFYGTKNDILKWMSSHSELLVEYDPLNEDNYEPELTPPTSPLSQEFLSYPMSISPMSTSPTSPTFLSTSPTSPTFPSFPTYLSTSPTSPTFPSFPAYLSTSPTSPAYLSTSPTSPAYLSTSPTYLSTSPTYLSAPTYLSTSPASPTSPTFPTFPTSPTSLTFPTSSTNENSHNIVFDLFTIPIKTSSILSEETAFNKPLNIALKHIPWLEVMLEIRPADEHIDSKLHPIHRVILPSGSSLSKISKALEKSWKGFLPDSTAFGHDCFIRNNELIYPQDKTKSETIIKPVNSDNEESLPNKFMAGIAKHVPSVDLWLRQKQTTGPIPPGVLTPYIIDDVLEDLSEKQDKKEEAEMNKELPRSEIAKHVPSVDLRLHQKQITAPGVLTPYIVDDVLEDLGEKEEDTIFRDKKEEAEMNKELPRPDLPRYETVFNDTLLERGDIIKYKYI